MKFVKRVLAMALLLLLAACDQNDAMTETMQKAESGDASAQTIVGSSYWDGRNGLTQDYFQGIHWFRKAAEQGEPYALRMLGNAYDRGAGVTRDYAQAAYWYRKAAEQGDGYGQYWLGAAYYRGEKGFNEPKDMVLAYAWVNLASDGYDKDAESLRDQVELALSPAELAEAQRLSSNWEKGQSIQRE